MGLPYIEVIPIKFKASQSNNDRITINGKVVMHFPNGEPLHAGDVVAGKVYEFEVDIPLQKTFRAPNWRLKCK